MPTVRPTLCPMTTTPPDPRRPPTVDDAVQQFMSLSQEFLELVPRLQTYTTGLSARASPPVSHVRTTRRVLVLALSLGRKFMTPGEATYLPGLLERVYTERKERIPFALRRPVRTTVQQVSAALRDLYSTGPDVSHADGTTTTAAQAWEQVAYGHVLHPDHEKWSAGNALAWWATSANGAFAVTRLRILIVLTRSLIEQLDEEGVFDGLGYLENLWINEDLWAEDGSPVDPETGSARGVAGPVW